MIKKLLNLVDMTTEDALLKHYVSDESLHISALPVSHGFVIIPCMTKNSSRLRSIENAGEVSQR